MARPGPAVLPRRGAPWAWGGARRVTRRSGGDGEPLVGVLVESGAASSGESVSPAGEPSEGRRAVKPHRDCDACGDHLPEGMMYWLDRARADATSSNESLERHLRLFRHALGGGLVAIAVVATAIVLVVLALSSTSALLGCPCLGIGVGMGGMSLPAWLRKRRTSRRRAEEECVRGVGRAFGMTFRRLCCD